MSQISTILHTQFNQHTLPVTPFKLDLEFRKENEILNSKCLEEGKSIYLERELNISWRMSNGQFVCFGLILMHVSLEILYKY